jgi:hypothetical protein
MIDKLDKLEKLLESDDGFVMKVRFLAGYDEEKLEELIALLNDIAIKLRRKKQAPKHFVNMLIDVIPTLISSSYSYDDIEERKKINKGIDDLSEAIRNCFI